MKSIRPRTDLVALLAFCLIFPGFFIYHFLVGKEYIPGLLGGYSTSMALLMLPLVANAYYREITRHRRHPRSVDAAFFAFEVYFACVVLVNIGIGTHMEIAAPLLAIVVQFVVIFMVMALINPSDVRFKAVVGISFAVLSSIILLNATEGTFVVAALDLQTSNEKIADYQSYAFVYTIVILYALFSTRSGWMRWLIYLLAIPALFLNGARTEFIGMLILALFIEFSISKNKLTILGVTFGLILFAAGVQDALIDLLPDNRVLVLFANSGVDDSTLDRANFLRAGWNTLSDHPLTGEFASYKLGEYIHNALSAWVDLGIVGFIFYLGLLVVPFLLLVRQLIEGSREPGMLLALSLLFLALLFAVTAKHYSHQMFPAAIGAFASYLQYSRQALDMTRRRFTPTSSILVQTNLKQSRG